MSPTAALRPCRRLLAILFLCQTAAGCMSPLATIDDGWTLVPDSSLDAPAPASPTPALRNETRLIDIPPAPVVWDYDDRPELPMTLAQATLAALRHNDRIAIIAYDPMIAEQQPILADSAFDTTFSLGGSYGKTDQPTATSIESLGAGGALKVDSFGVANGQRNNLAISKPLRSGGIAFADYGFTYDRVDSAGQFLLLNPSWRTTLNVAIEQPLVQGRGREVSELGIRVAKANHRLSQNEFEGAVQDLLRDVSLSYWSLASAILNYESIRKSATAADATRDRLVQQFRVGRADLQDLAQGTLYGETVDASVSRALAELQDAEQAFRVVIGHPTNDEHRIIPVEPLVRDDFQPDWEQGVQQAYERRYDLKAQTDRIAAAKLELRQSVELLRPDINAFASARSTGLDDNLADATDLLTDVDYASWSLGIRYEKRLGRRAEKASYRAAQLALARERKTLAAVEENVMNELREAYRRVHASLKAVQHERTRLEAAQLFVDARMKMFDLGLLTLEQRLDAETIAIDAESTLLIALTDYNQAIVQWQYATGAVNAPPIGQLRTGRTTTNDALELLRNPPPPPKLAPIEEPMLPSAGFDFDALMPAPAASRPQSRKQGPPTPLPTATPETPLQPIATPPPSRPIPN